MVPDNKRILTLKEYLVIFSTAPVSRRKPCYTFHSAWCYKEYSAVLSTAPESKRILGYTSHCTCLHKNTVLPSWYLTPEECLVSLFTAPVPRRIFSNTFHSTWLLEQLSNTVFSAASVFSDSFHNTCPRRIFSNTFYCTDLLRNTEWNFLLDLSLGEYSVLVSTASDSQRTLVIGSATSFSRRIVILSTAPLSKR